MEDKEYIETLVEALRLESSIMSDTYTKNTEIMCETIKRLDKTKTHLVVGVVAMVFMFFVLLLLLPV